MVSKTKVKFMVSTEDMQPPVKCNSTTLKSTSNERFDVSLIKSRKFQ